MSHAKEDTGSVIDGDVADLADVVDVANFDGVFDVVHAVGDIAENYDDFKTEV